MSRDVSAYGLAVAAGVLGLGVGVGLAVAGARWSCGSKVSVEPLKACRIPPQAKSNPYEAMKLVNEYMAFHYCPCEEYLVYDYGPEKALDFPKRCAELCLRHKPEGVLCRALDVGCAVGRATFELAREYSEVVGIDYSQGFIAKCQELKMTGQSPYTLFTEGHLGEEKMARIDPAIDRSKVHFTVGDACHLPQLGQFGCVFGGNLICRLPDPMKFLNRLPELIVPGGILVLTCPYTWLEEYTPKKHWLGGYVEGGREVHSFDRLREILELNFDLLEEKDFPFLIRETVRKNQWTVAHATAWRRKEQA